MEKKELTPLQREVIRMKKEKIDEAINELGRIANEVAREQGIDEAEFGKWEISDDNRYLERKE